MAEKISLLRFIVSCLSGLIGRWLQNFHQTHFLFEQEYMTRHPAENLKETPNELDVMSTDYMTGFIVL